MLRLVRVYQWPGDRLAFTPAWPDDEPVFSAFVLQTGTRISATEVRLGRFPGEPFTASSFVFAARLRAFRLRVCRDWLWPNRRPGPAPKPRRRAQCSSRSTATPR